MRMHRRRDSRLLDALEAIGPTRFEGPVWRTVAEGRSPLVCSASGGLWDDGSFEVLYTSLAREGSLAEMYFHLRRGQPVFPSRVRYRLFELTVAMSSALKLVDLRALAALGIDPQRYGSLSWVQRTEEYPRTQDIAEAAHFLEFDGMLVPSARWDTLNAIVFCDRCAPGQVMVQCDHGLIDWVAVEAGMASRSSGAS